MLTWAMVYLAKLGFVAPIFFMATIVADVAIVFFVACAFAGWPK